MENLNPVIIKYILTFLLGIIVLLVYGSSINGLLTAIGHYIESLAKRMEEEE